MRVLARAPHSVAEHLRRNGEELVVDEARVGGEDAHQEDVVAPLVERAEHLVGSEVRELLLEIAQQPASERHHDPVTDITEHDTEEEGEGDDREDGGVELLVPRGTVRVDDRLRALRELGGAEVGGRGLAGLDHVEHRLHAGAALGRALAQCLADRVHVVDGRPALGDEALVRDVIVEHVECVKHRLLPQHARLPRLQVLCKLLQPPLAVVVRAA
mmetsp:Transcript_59342/g.145717  ORF Transcript_59342/g.145717 Transcript_59342/m.145717 type:complete len:215 (-) Transcript_59342:1069-1713(-)